MEQDKRETQHNPLLRLALSMYVGEKCIYCEHVYTSVDDIVNRDVVCAENSGSGIKYACNECFARQNQSKDV